MFAFLDGVESRRGGGISRNGNPIGKAWHCTQAGSGDVFPTGTHVNAPSLVSCLPARLIFEHASFDAYLPSPSLASAREARNIRLRFHRPQPRTFSNGKSKYPYLLTSLDFLALLGEGKEKKERLPLRLRPFYRTRRVVSSLCIADSTRLRANSSTRNTSIAM